MSRVPLDALALQVLLLGLGQVYPFLSKAIEPPEAVAVAESMRSLEELGGIEEIEPEPIAKAQQPAAQTGKKNKGKPPKTGGGDGNGADQVYSEEHLRSRHVLTPLGHHLARLPVPPRLGIILVLSSVFSCVDPMLTIAACMGGRNVFVSPVGKREVADACKREMGQ